MQRIRVCYLKLEELACSFKRRLWNGLAKKGQEKSVSYVVTDIDLCGASKSSLYGKRRQDQDQSIDQSPNEWYPGRHSEVSSIVDTSYSVSNRQHSALVEDDFCAPPLSMDGPLIQRTVPGFEQITIKKLNQERSQLTIRQQYSPQ